MTMTNPDIVVSGAHAHAIASLSRELHLPIADVSAVYHSQLDRIGASARIHHYLGVLATSLSRRILRRFSDAAEELH